MVEFVEKKEGLLARKKILDLGCGGGGISIAFAEKCKHVTAVDLKEKNISLLKQRLQERRYKNVSLLRGNALNLPFKNMQFDKVIVNGLLEWVNWDREEAPAQSQGQLLAEVFRVLKKGGILYLGIENRWCLINFIRDPHMKIPFVTVLPQRIADWISIFLASRPYQMPIHSYWKLRQMLIEKGFAKVCIYAPLINYRYPIVYLPLDKDDDSMDKELKLGEIGTKYREADLGKLLIIKLLYIKLIHKLSLGKLFTPGFVALAYK